MPTGLVKTKRDERLWNAAKAAARKQYPKVKEGTDRFWKIVNGIYHRMKGDKDALAGGKGKKRRK